VRVQSALGAFVVALAVGLFVGRVYERAFRSRRDYAAGVKAMKTYQKTMHKHMFRAVIVVGSLAFIMAAIFWAAMKSGQS
jgi:hypothetical protein